MRAAASKAQSISNVNPDRHGESQTTSLIVSCFVFHPPLPARRNNRLQRCATGQNAERRGQFGRNETVKSVQGKLEGKDEGATMEEKKKEINKRTSDEGLNC